MKVLTTLVWKRVWLRSRVQKYTHIHTHTSLQLYLQDLQYLLCSRISTIITCALYGQCTNNVITGNGNPTRTPYTKTRKSTYVGDWKINGDWAATGRRIFENANWTRQRHCRIRTSGIHRTPNFRRSLTAGDRLPRFLESTRPSLGWWQDTRRLRGGRDRGETLLALGFHAVLSSM